MTRTSPAIVAALVLGAGALLTQSSQASQAVAPTFKVVPVLVKSSGGAFVHFQLDRRAVGRRVLIAGQTARISTTGNPSDAVYDAFVKDSTLKSGREYSVSIRVVSASGGITSRVERLFLHRGFPRR